MPARVKKRVTWDAAYEMRKQLAAEIRPSVRAIRNSARRFEGSSLKTRSGKTGRKIGARVRPRRRNEGVIISVGATKSILQVWEHGRKAYTITANAKSKRKVLKIAEGVYRTSVKIPAAAARPVLMPAVDRNMGMLKAASAKAAVQGAQAIIERTIVITK